MIMYEILMSLSQQKFVISSTLRRLVIRDLSTWHFSLISAATAAALCLHQQCDGQRERAPPPAQTPPLRGWWRGRGSLARGAATAATAAGRTAAAASNAAAAATAVIVAAANPGGSCLDLILEESCTTKHRKTCHT